MPTLYRYVIVLAVILVLSAGALLFYSWSMELDRTSAMLAETREALASTQNELEDAVSTLSHTTAALSEQQVLTANLEDDVAQLQQKERQLREDLAAVKERNSSLLSELGATRSLLASTTTELDTTQNTLTETEGALEEQTALALRLDEENGALLEERKDLEGRLETVTGQYADLVERAGTKEQLEEDATELQQEIRDLENQRAPLILSPNDLHRTGFLCTGSMEPTISCLDEATWLADFRPEDIVVGATIVFSPSCWNTQRVAHRVLEVEVRNGTHYFWPKGDGNRQADGCWVPETNVEMYIVEVHRNVRPENAALRNHVNSAKDTYYELLDRYCGDIPSQECRLPNREYSEVRAAFDNYSCWTDVALNSRNPGHIPENTCR